MFTGIVTDIGEVVAIDGGHMTLRTTYAPQSIALGASIACNGCCLTATTVSAAGAGAEFSVDVSNETLAKTTLGSWQKGERVNLERSLSIGDEMGGHIVTGHVDAVAVIEACEKDGESMRFRIAIPEGFAHLIAAKGSVALDGVSLTVNDIDTTGFGVNIVPHTLGHTTWGSRGKGDRLNLEVDLLARYVARISEMKGGGVS